MRREVEWHLRYGPYSYLTLADYKENRRIASAIYKGTADAGYIVVDRQGIAESGTNVLTEDEIRKIVDEFNMEYAQALMVRGTEAEHEH